MLNLTSPDFTNGGLIPQQFSCLDSNINPTLKITNVPAKTKSLVLIVTDPDAPGGVFTHWLLWNIDPNITDISANSIPTDSVQGKNDFGNYRYDGPCPPSGTHHYIFHLYALDATLNLDIGTSRQSLESAIKNHILDQTQLTGLYQKN